MAKPKILISRCLLGEAVRYDGKSKRDDGLLAAFSGEVEWVGVCPECEAGFGVPHAPLKLAGTPVRLVEVPSGRDRSEQMAEWLARKLEFLAQTGLSGAIFKAKSPSCAIGTAPNLAPDGSEFADGDGFFVRAFRQRFPELPVADEISLRDPERLAGFRRDIGL